MTLSVPHARSAQAGDECRVSDGQRYILDRMDVPRVFRKAPHRLTADGVAELFEVARRSSTWVG
jgi:hypothetical protein